ncbi:hypothetical protein TSMEX_008544 [Taenia solium]|eukprot:TsM_000217100 transcript=TsM_000217100 gene=TsM_000217100
MSGRTPKLKLDISVDPYFAQVRAMVSMGMSVGTPAARLERVLEYGLLRL